MLSNNNINPGETCDLYSTYYVLCTVGLSLMLHFHLQPFTVCCSRLSLPHHTSLFEPSGSLYKLTHLQSSIHRPLIQRSQTNDIWWSA